MNNRSTLHAVFLMGALVAPAINQAASMKYVGAWNPSKAYEVGQVVNFENNLWMSLIKKNKNTAPSPGAEWQIVGAGTPGPTGPQGEPGVVGPVGPQGPTGLQGPVGPAGPIGLTGLKGDTGPQGLKGETGPAGINGKSILSGNSAPSPEAGVFGDLFLDTAQNKMYGPKSDTGWGEGVTLVGPMGAPGVQGPQGVQGQKGDKGDKGDVGQQGAKGDDGSFPAGENVGDLQFWDGSQWKMIPAPPTSHQATLKFCYGTPTWSDCTYTVGDTGPAGGKVFFVTDGGRHGLEAALTDIGPAPWGCENAELGNIGADQYGGGRYHVTSYDIGAGRANTLSAMTNCGVETAAGLAYRFSYNGFQDWYLPSFRELEKLYDNRNSVGGFDGYYYWSSSESETQGSEHSLAIVFPTGASGTNWSLLQQKRSYPMWVRPIRSF